jgi:hypothetical protein
MSSRPPRTEKKPFLLIMRKSYNKNLWTRESDYECIDCCRIRSPYSSPDCECEFKIVSCFICKAPISPYDSSDILDYGSLSYHQGCVEKRGLVTCDCDIPLSPYSKGHFLCLIDSSRCYGCQERITPYSPRQRGMFCSSGCRNSNFSNCKGKVKS